MPKRTTPRRSRFDDPIKEATIVALKHVVDPLVDLMFDAGVTVREFSSLIRERAVWSAARRVANESGRDSKSRVAIVTGLARAEVARILRSKQERPRARSGQHPARKVLAAWFDNPRYLAANGDPDVLPIFGKRRSFERLVAMHSRGIPVRAMLDELVQIDAVELLSDQRIKAKSRTPISTGLTISAVTAIGERAKDLLGTLTNNVRNASNPLFEGTALLDEADLETIALVRRELAEQGATFVNSANSLLRRSRVKQTRAIVKSSSKCRLGITVFYFQNRTEGNAESQIETIHRRRKNLRRHFHSKHTAAVNARAAVKDIS